MKKFWLTAALFASFAAPSFSQTLFSYGPHKVSTDEFLRAYNKNNQQLSGNKTSAMKEYLDLYINSRLRIQEAYDRHYDTLPQVRDEVMNLRNQIIDNYMSDPEAVSRLTKEAFQRSQKDIHVAHLFIAFNKDGVLDTARARRNLALVNQRLAKGDDFGKIAQELSDDPSAKENKGDLNYITVFTLPYEFENIVYGLTPGKYSKPYTSSGGYHFFKDLGERKSIGRMRIQQILVAFPPQATDADKAMVARRADSVYRLVTKGGDFAKLASALSNDYITAASNGNMPDIGVGQYDPTFEKIVWAIPTDGAIAKPFMTAYGYHIVKRIKGLPIVTDASDQINNEALQQKVTTDDRWKTARDFIFTKVKAKAGFKTFYNEQALWSFSDSLLDMKPAGAGRSMTRTSPIFKVGDSTVTVTEWMGYVQANRYKADRATLKDYNSLMNEFTKQVMYQYYRGHLELFNDDFKNQMSEFRDGNLFFEIMQQEVWNKAQGDSSALVRLYEKDKAKYSWTRSADAVLLFCSDSAIGGTLLATLRSNPGVWRRTVEGMNEKVVADSSRYEWDQLPGLDGKTPVAHSFTPLLVNPNDNTASFAYIFNVYTTPTQRSFAEAKGLVMNDYQAQIEEKWTNELKKKYPVVVDQKVLASIAR